MWLEGQLNNKAKFSRATRHFRAGLPSEKIELTKSVAWRLTSVVLDLECAVAAWSFEVSCLDTFVNDIPNFDFDNVLCIYHVACLYNSQFINECWVGGSDLAISVPRSKIKDSQNTTVPRPGLTK
jgi:hypothetical protein